MEAILKELQSPVWWVSVVIAGLIVNVISGYLKTHCDKLLAKLSTSWARRNEKARADRRQLISSLRADPHWQLVFATEVSTRFSCAIYWLVFSQSFFIFGFLMIFGNDHRSTAMEAMRVASVAAGVITIFTFIKKLSAACNDSVAIAESLAPANATPQATPRASPEP